jgi:hypothetical protein
MQYLCTPRRCTEPSQDWHSPKLGVANPQTRDARGRPMGYSSYALDADC